MNLASLTKYITNFFHKKSKVKKDKDPYFDWFVMMITFYCVFIVIALIDGYIFYKLDHNELFTNNGITNTPVPSFDRMLLKQENDYYNSQEQNFNTIQATSTASIDPGV